MAWWQKKLLRYALSRTGFLDDKALDLDNLDIALGSKNVVELKNVGLNIKRISKIVQLPPSLRVETARVLSLRLTVPADIYQSSIIAEVDGVDLTLKLEEKEDKSPPVSKSRPRSPVTTRIPQHRKVQRRSYSPPPFDPGGLSDSDEHLPTTEELAKSFLLEEPISERRVLEASIAANNKGLDESIVSESSDGDDLGTGASIGLPGFLAGFLQGILDRFQVTVKNVEAKLETAVSGDGLMPVPITLRLHVGSAGYTTTTSEDGTENAGQTQSQSTRKIKLDALSLHLLSDAAVFSELSELPSHTSPALSRARSESPVATRGSDTINQISPRMHPTTSSLHESLGSDSSGGKVHQSRQPSDPMRASLLTVGSERFADAGEEELPSSLRSQHVDLDIQPGDDNISWASRRSKSNAPTEDLWNSMTSEDNLPDSLLIQRPSTPRARFSRHGDSSAAKPVRDTSPYTRSLQSPGSWPRLDESPQRHRYYQGPGSWPVLDQSQQSMFQPLTPETRLPLNEGVDNKRAALETSMVEDEEFDTPPEPADDVPDDLMTSRMFTHQEAESMYMSAMTHGSRMHVPGGWGSEDAESEYSVASNAFQQPVPDAPYDEDLAYGEQPYSTPGNVTPRAISPNHSKSEKSHEVSDPTKASRQLLFIDTAVVSVPISSTAATDSGPLDSAAAKSTANLPLRPLPGAFSTYSEMSASKKKPVSFSREGSSNSVLWTPKDPSTGSAEPASIDLELGNVTCQVEIPCGRLLYRLIMKSLAIFTPSTPDQTVTKDEGKTAMSLLIHHLQVCFRESSTAVLDPEKPLEPVNNLVTLDIRDANLSSTDSSKEVRLASFATFVGSSCLLSFDRSRDMSASVVISDQTPDISLLLNERKASTTRPISAVKIETLPLDLFLDLQIVDDTFESFGGLSGLFEVGNSILSDSGLTSSPTSQAKSSKGVRFQGDPQTIGSDPEWKVNGRIGAVRATLQGSACSMELRTTTVNMIYRAHGAVATMNRVLLSGPYASNDADASMTIELSTLRLEYLLTPQDKDLERLLSLIIPSKDKYDNDDDILIDTLLRQRRKGAVANVSVSDVRHQVHSWDCIPLLSTFGNELSKLSAVAKYLPEDERPGVLTLIRSKDYQGRIPVNERFGNLHVRISDFHCAHVGLPALLALSVGTVKASQEDENELVHSLVPLTGPENLPVVMARMLGDEIEPTVKVKLFNLCIEYSVPIILGLTGMDKDTNTEELVAGLANSVADFALPREDSFARQSAAASETSDSSSKKVNLNLLIHDSAVGLSPRTLSSKALLVLTDARLSTSLPAEENMVVQLELRKAGVFLADEILPADADTTVPARGSPINTGTKPKLTLALSKQGFVSVGSVLAAKVLARVEKSADGDAKTVDVDVRNELLLLETCADSTQTLIATLNGLVPPTPPNKQPKYLTQPMTIEDMMASFTGDAFERPQRSPETLFDGEEDPEDDPDMLLDIPTIDEDEDSLLAESEMTSSLYGPVSGILGDVDSPEEDDSEHFPETVESLLEDDPFEMPNSPLDTKMSDGALFRELEKQRKPSLDDRFSDLGIYEIKDLGFDALGGNQRALGSQHRFNTPATSKRTGAGVSRHKDIPFRLQLRDLHIIWKIYDGYDWQRTRDGISQAVEQVEIKAEERKAKQRQSLNEREDDESVIGDFLFNSIYIGVPSNHDAQELRRQINRNIDDLASETESMPVSAITKPTTTFSASGRLVRPRPKRRLKLERGRTHKIAFEMKGLSADVLVFAPDSADIVSSVDIRLKDLEIFDNVPTSTWRKFLTHLSNEPGSRELSKPMFHIELLNVRTLEQYAASEIVMHVSVLPLRLHVDQDALDFITRFFEFKDESTNTSDSAGEQPFLQRVEVDTVDLQLDYKPKKVDYVGLRSGHTTEFMNFIILDAANIRLKHAIIYGIKGFEPLHKTLNDIWMPDVKRNQLPTVLAGLAPVRSLVNIGSGIRDVIAIPVREYQKDGRIVRSVQKGALQFGKTTASELARLGAKVAMGTQTFLQGAEGFLTPTSGSPGRPSPARRNSDQGWQEMRADDEEREPRAISAYANQPLGIFAGLRSAQRQLEYDLLTAKDALIAVQGEILESSGPGGAAAAVVKHAPTVILRPIIGTSRAVGTALLGVGNQIDRENARRIEDKYKRR